MGVRAQVKGLAFCKRRDISSKDILVERDINIPSLGKCSLISVLKCHLKASVLIFQFYRGLHLQGSITKQSWTALRNTEPLNLNIEISSNRQSVDGRWRVAGGSGVLWKNWHCGRCGFGFPSTVHQPGNFGPVFSICQHLSFLIAKGEQE